MGYLLFPDREHELGESRGPQRWAAWPSRTVVGDQIEVSERGINRRFALGQLVDTPDGKQAEVVGLGEGSAMFFGSVSFEVLADVAAATPRSRPSVLSEGEQ
jgi:hypothetical protein